MEEKVIRHLKKLSYSQKEIEQILLPFVFADLIGKNYLGTKIISVLLKKSGQKTERLSLKEFPIRKSSCVSAQGEFLSLVLEKYLPYLSQKIQAQGFWSLNINQAFNVPLPSFYAWRLSQITQSLAISLTFLPAQDVVFAGKGLLSSNPVSIALPYPQGYLIDFALSEKAFAKLKSKKQNFFGGIKGLNLALFSWILMQYLGGTTFQNDNSYHQNKLIYFTLMGFKLNQKEKWQKALVSVINYMKQNSPQWHIPGGNYQKAWQRLQTHKTLSSFFQIKNLF